MHTHKKTPQKKPLNKQPPEADTGIRPNSPQSFIIHYVLYLFDSLSWKDYSKVQSVTALCLRVSQAAAATRAV